MFDSDLYNRKKYFAEKGRFYLPLFLHELKEQHNRFQIYSYIRRLLYDKFPTIYSYTGANLSIYDASDLVCDEVSWTDASFFFGRCKFIPTFIKSDDVYIVLKSDNNIVASMVFTRPWAFNENYDWQLLIYVEELNTIVNGGFEKLFEFFKNRYLPRSVVYNADVRFVDFDPDVSVVKDLGFDYISYIKPDFEYRCPDNTVTSKKSANAFVRFLTTFDPTLSNSENLEKAGYVQLFDCGYYRYVWTEK
jgi:hypothetical protein